jgi:hypothetical protein
MRVGRLGCTRSGHSSSRDGGGEEPAAAALGSGAEAKPTAPRHRRSAMVAAGAVAALAAREVVPLRTTASCRARSWQPDARWLQDAGARGPTTSSPSATRARWQPQPGADRRCRAAAEAGEAAPARQSCWTRTCWTLVSAGAAGPAEESGAGCGSRTPAAGAAAGAEPGRPAPAAGKGVCRGSFPTRTCSSAGQVVQGDGQGSGLAGQAACSSLAEGPEVSGASGWPPTLEKKVSSMYTSPQYLSLPSLD